jgi:hypothetical protein
VTSLLAVLAVCQSVDQSPPPPLPPSPSTQTRS